MRIRDNDRSGRSASGGVEPETGELAKRTKAPNAVDNTMSKTPDVPHRRGRTALGVLPTEATWRLHRGPGRARRPGLPWSDANDDADRREEGRVTRQRHHRLSRRPIPKTSPPSFRRQRKQQTVRLTPTAPPLQRGVSHVLLELSVRSEEEAKGVEFSSRSLRITTRVAANFRAFSHHRVNKTSTSIEAHMSS